MALIDKLTAIADGFRASRGTTQEYSLDEMAILAAEPVGGNDETLVAMVERTMTEFVATEQMARIGENAFQNAISLRSADLSRLGAQNSSLTNLIGFNAFDGCTNLDHIVLPEVLAKASKSTQWLASRAFQNTRLTEFVTDYKGELGWNSVQIFKSCPVLRTVRIPNISFLSFEYFNGCASLELVEFGGGTVGSLVFKACVSLRTVIIRSDTMAKLSTTNSFDGIGARVDIYVKESLIEEYRAATNWSSLYANGTVDFVAIEGSEYE